ncbi:MAG: hypothetical protein ACI4DY_12250, partial [Monoglobaceae bacterium]
SITGRSIMDYINGYIKQNEANLQYAQANLELREHAWANTLNKLQNAKVGKDRKAKDYIAAVRSWLVEDDKIRMYSTMKELLVAFKSQIEELRTSFFSVFTDVFAELQDTFRENLAYFAEPQLQNVDNSKKIITIDELRDTLDESVSEFNIDSLLRDFVGMMMSDPNVWITRDANKISAAVNGYFACMFDVYTRKSIIDYLQIKYDTTTPQILREHIYNDLVLRLHNESKPLLWLDQSYYHTQSIASMGYVVAPENAPEVIDAVDQYVANIGVTERIDRRLASYNDSISFVRIAYGIPMFAYQGVTLYLESYKNNSRAGIHIYEGAKGDARDSRELVDIMPI